MEFRKGRDSFGYPEYALIKGEKSFKILFGNNGDLYWTFTDLSDAKINYGTFMITIDDDYFIYSLFEKLYLKIKNVKVYDNDPLEDDFMIFSDMHNPMDLNKRLRYLKCYNELFDGEKITWISDDRDYDKDQIVQISKHDDSFLLEFARRDKADLDKHNYLHCFDDFSVGIRFSNSGSSYDPFNIVFIQMYNDLDGYSKDNNRNNEIEGQIHIDDYLQSLK